MKPPFVRNYKATPLMVNGTLYVNTAASVGAAYDARTGAQLWQYDPKTPGEIAVKVCCGIVNRDTPGNCIAFPGQAGNIVCKTIRSNPNFEHTKIIIVSGVVNQDEINDLLKAGADEFVKKPFNIEKLIERIGELLAV